MKKVLALFLAGLTMLSMAACGKSQSAAGSDSTSEESTVSGTSYDVGEFTISIPDGWMVLPQENYFEEADENGNYPIRTDAIALIKGASMEMDTLTKPTLYIYLFRDSKAKDKAETDTAWYDETSPITVTINDKEINTAFEGKTASTTEDGSYIYDSIYYQINKTDVIQFIVPVDMISFKGVSTTDDDVAYILNSVTLNEE